MSHDHHGGGGGGGGAGGLQATNMHLAESFWYIIASATGLAVVVRGINYLESRRRLHRRNTESVTHPTKPNSLITQIWATTTALVREASHPRLFIPVRGLQWLSPPPLGRSLILLAYFAVIIYMAAGHGAVIDDIFFWERIGFRNAWTTIMQMPLVYLLAMKGPTNPITLLTGISPERLNWLHRWVARAMFVTATVHGGYFWTQWVRADFIEFQLQILPTTKEGIGAWFVLLWTFLSTMKPFRSMAYELFVIQHLASYIVFIYLVYVHIPVKAQPYLWFAVACLCFDRLARWSLLLWQNLRAKPDKSKCRGIKRIGHQVQIQAVGDSTTVITMKDVPFSWKPGQYLYLWLPRLGPFEAHPYTIACAQRLPGTCVCNSIQLVVRKHGGFSKRLHNHARKMEVAGQQNMTFLGFVFGPSGTPPRWDIYETLILISASTGASFTLPILEAIVQSKTRDCIKRVDFVLLASQGEEIDFYLQRLRRAVNKAFAKGLELTVHIAITKGAGRHERLTNVFYNDNLEDTPAAPAIAAGCCCHSSSRTDATSPERQRPLSEASTSSRESEAEKTSGGERNKLADAEKNALITKRSKEQAAAAQGPQSTHTEFIREYYARPDMEALIRGPIEASGGETSVVVCGGESLTNCVRNTVSRLSDERAVHKGTGAQGIHLFVEEYSF